MISHMEQVLRAFLWSGPELKPQGVKVSWCDITGLKCEGGLGIKNLEEWNKVAMAKHIWIICRNPHDSLWVD